MRSIKKLWSVAILAIVFVLAAPHKSKAQYSADITFQNFYDELAPYGTWVEDPEYGDVWVPDAGPGFRPYATNGYWVYTDYGTTWVSDYPWGWATFHYGRWRYDDYYGWEWIPGYEWAPAWVGWRHSREYYGWAPLGPGLSLSFSIGSIPSSYWVCAPAAYITSQRINNYYITGPRVVNIINNTTVIRNTYVNNNQMYVGPRPQEIRQITHRDVPVYRINNATRPGAPRVEQHAVNIFRPAVTRMPDARPTRVVDARAYRNEHPNARIASPNRGLMVDHGNAARLAQVARTANPENSRVVRVNRPGAPVNNGQFNRNQQQMEQGRRQQMEQQRQQQMNQQHDQQMNQQRQQQMEQGRRQQMEQQRQQQMNQQRDQQMNQQRQQQMEQQRQQQRDQQMQQQRQQQMEQQRQQQRDQQMQQQRQQQMEQQRQQQRDQQMQQQRQQQMEQQRQQQMMQQRQQQMEQQRQQQMEQQRQQQMQQQRQQQMEQQRQQQMQQQRQQQQQRPEERQDRDHRQ